MRLCPGRGSAICACFALCAVYVGVLYIGYDPSSRSRDEPAVILQRFARVLAVCALSPLLLVAFSRGLLGDGVDANDTCATALDVPLSDWLGVRSAFSDVAALADCALATAAALVLTSLLYLGPLAMMDAADWRSLMGERFAPTLVNTRALLVVRAARAAACRKPRVRWAVGRGGWCGGCRLAWAAAALLPPCCWSAMCHVPQQLERRCLGLLGERVHVCLHTVCACVRERERVKGAAAAVSAGRRLSAAPGGRPSSAGSACQTVTTLPSGHPRPMARIPPSSPRAA
jgi:dienelactone hydrolase